MSDGGGGNMSIFTCRDLLARDWPFILMEVFHRAGQAVPGCGNQGCDKLLVSATEVINEGLIHSAAVAPLTKCLVW